MSFILIWRLRIWLLLKDQKTQLEILFPFEVPTFLSIQNNHVLSRCAVEAYDQGGRHQVVLPGTLDY